MPTDRAGAAFVARIRRGLARRLDPPPPPVPIRVAQVKALQVAEYRLRNGTTTRAERKALRSVIRAFEWRKRRDLRARQTAEQRRAIRDRAMSLTEIAQGAGTDKWGVHYYTPHYERHLEHLRDQAFTLLEIGIGGYSRERQGGASLRMWKQFFQEATIVGLDIEDKSFVEEDRIHAVLGSQTDEVALRKAIAAHGAPMVVIDDGSHVPADIVATFGILFPLLPDGAIYAIEDTQTSYWPEWGGQEDPAARGTSMDLVKQLVDGLNHEEFVLEDYTPTYTDLHVAAVHCFHNLVIIEKGPNTEGTNKRQVLRERYAEADN
jgi:hypothetical protein